MSGRFACCKQHLVVAYNNKTVEGRGPLTTEEGAENMRGPLTTVEGSREHERAADNGRGPLKT